MADFDESLYSEQFPDVCLAIKKSGKKCCSTTTVKNFIPIIDWLPKYRFNLFVYDFVAGLTVGLTTIPQAIAYGAIAGLPPQYGLYSAFMGCFVYFVFGTSKDVTVGPTAIMSLMVQSRVDGNADFAVLLCFLSGFIMLAMGLLNLGVLVRFISMPVVTGFTISAAITIGSGQINNLFGIKSSSNEFLPSWENFFTHIKETQLNDALIGVITLIGLLLMRKVKDIPCQYKSVTKYISLSRNAIAVIIGILLCYLLSDGDDLPFKVSGQITPGIPPFHVPPFSTNINGTDQNFGEMVSFLGSSLATIPLISILESVAIAKAFAKGKIVDATQEMIAVGLCNLLGSFFSSMPVTGSFTRSAINNASGVRTQLGNVVTGALVLMALAFLTNTFYYIPKATLAAIIIAAMIFMVEYDKVIEIWKAKKIDLFPFLVTLLVCLFWSLEYGIICGIIANLIFVLYTSARPKIIINKEKINGFTAGIVEVKENLSYSAAEYLKCKIIKFVNTQEDSINIIVINGEEINSIDTTVALNILSIKEDLKVLNVILVCWNWNINAAGVVCRLNREARNMFQFGKTIDTITTKEAANSLQNGNDVTVVSL